MIAHLAVLGLQIIFYGCLGLALMGVVIAGFAAFLFAVEQIVIALLTRWDRRQMRRTERDRCIASIEEAPDCWEGFEDAREHHPAQVAHVECRRVL